jgi:hypothetical protein
MVVLKKDLVEPLFYVQIDINCQYTSNIIFTIFKKIGYCKIVENLWSSYLKNVRKVQIADFENIGWSEVMKSSFIGASSYLIRKGLSRKAQLSLQIKKFVSKNPTSILKTQVPFTIIIETWNAFEEMKVTSFPTNISQFHNLYPKNL